MIEVKMKMAIGGDKFFPAWKVLQHINASEFIDQLQGMNWHTTGKVNFLTGKVTSTQAEIAEPLTNEQAKQAVKEYLAKMS